MGHIISVMSARYQESKGHINKITDNSQVHLHLSAGVSCRNIHICNYLAYRKLCYRTRPAFLQYLIYPFNITKCYHLSFPFSWNLTDFNQGSKRYWLNIGSGFMCESRSQLDLKRFSYFLYQETFLWWPGVLLVLLKAQRMEGWPLRLFPWSTGKDPLFRNSN